MILHSPILSSFLLVHRFQSISGSVSNTTDFIDFQYGELNPENRAHKSVLDLLEKYKLNDSWIDPSDENNSNQSKHVARTPESEAARQAHEQEELITPKMKRITRRDRRNPSGLSVTTGKYKSKKRKKFD